jgi:hypothetical protein
LKDTLVYLDELLPNETYTIKLTNQDGIGTQTEFTTMDTTSHNFTWETFEFGGAKGSSYLRDVAIIDENNIWAVGEIFTEDTYTYDSNGVWQQPYNAVHWDGNEWELKRIIVNFRDNPTFIPLEGIYAFASNDIWMVGSLPIHGNGTNWEIYDVREITNSSLSLSKAWGTSSEDMYFVGRAGSIAHYNGSSWSKIESGTELDLYDIWGDKNEQTGEYEILAVGAKLLQSTDRVIISIKPYSSQILSNNGIDWSLKGIWFRSKKKYYVVGSGIYFKNELGVSDWDSELDSLTNYYSHSIRGKEINDIIISGAYNDVLHYNGVNWKGYRGKINNSQTGILEKVAMKNGTVCIVGQNNPAAVLYLGYR